MAEPRVLCWVSAGAASAIAAKMTIAKYGRERIVLVYCETGSEHPDNERFLGDLSRWMNAPIERLRSEVYRDTWDVWERRRYLSGINGAPCTVELKVAPRLAFQRPNDIHVFGYTADAADANRAKRLRDTYPEMTIETPLIEGGVTKAACLAMIERVGIALPVLYGLGFRNNNCLACVKATSPDYWALVRLHFPATFDRLAKLSRELGARLARINDERVFIDEIPADQPTLNPIVPSCDFLCAIAEQDMERSA